MAAAQTRGGAISCGDTHAAGSSFLLVDGAPVVLVGDLSTGHAGFPPTPAIEGSPTVLVDGRAVVRYGDRYIDHRRKDTVHRQRSGVQSTSYELDGPVPPGAAALLDKLAQL